jgi:hypothetical protein
MKGLLLGQGAFRFDPTGERIGPAPDAMMLHHVFSGGALEGPFLHLRVLPGGGEWASVRGDGVATVESRHSLQTSRDEYVFARFSGVYDFGNDGYENVLFDRPLQGLARVEVAIRYHAAASEYRWLNRLLCIGLGERDFTRSLLAVRVYGFGEYAAFVLEQQRARINDGRKS